MGQFITKPERPQGACSATALAIGATAILLILLTLCGQAGAQAPAAAAIRRSPLRFVPPQRRPTLADEDPNSKAPRAPTPRSRVPLARRLAAPEAAGSPWKSPDADEFEAFPDAPLPGTEVSDEHEAADDAFAEFDGEEAEFCDYAAPCPPGFDPDSCLTEERWREQVDEFAEELPSSVAEEALTDPNAAQSQLGPGDFSGEGASGAAANNQFASSLGAASGGQSAAPNMIGDFFGGSAAASTVQVIGPQQTLPNLDYLAGGVLYNGKLVATDQVAFFKSVTDNAFFVSRDIPPSFYAGQVIGLANTQPYTDAAGNPRGSAPPLEIVNGTATIQPDLLATVQFRPVERVAMILPSPGMGGAVGSFKIAENTSPIPRDRLFFDYDYFHNVPLTAAGIGVNRYAPGFEKTLFNGLTSFELRVPMATTLSSAMFADSVTGTQYELGNLTMAAKALLLQSDVFGLSLGMSWQLPTANNVTVSQRDGLQLVEIENQAVHLQPFFGALYTPDDRRFLQSFIQIDSATRGNDVRVNMTGNGLRTIGSVNDPAVFYASLGGGSWLFRRDGQRRGLSGLAWTAELHYNRTLARSDAVAGGNYLIGTAGNSFEVLNGTLGATMQWRQRGMLTLAYVTPLTGGEGRQFDGQLRVFFNYFFGRQNRLTRVPIF